MSPCHPFRPVPGQCGPNRRGPLPAPPFDPRDYWATKKFVSSLFESIETKIDKFDVVDPSAEAEAGKAADAKGTYEGLNRVLGVASDARVLAESKADRATTLAGYGITDAATKEELAAKADLVDGKVPASQLPSYVDDVLEYDAVSAFPATGESGKIYVAKDANKTYRWSGTQYVEISPLPVLDDTVTEKSPNGVKSSGIWSWVKSLLPHWLTSDYAEPATVASVAEKRDKSELAVYSVTRTENTDWTWTSENKELEAALNNGVKLEYNETSRTWVPQHDPDGYWSEPKLGSKEELSVSIVVHDNDTDEKYTATATRPRYMDETLGPEKPNQQLAAVATDDAAKPADGSLMKYDAANDRFVKATAGTDYADEATGTDRQVVRGRVFDETKWEIRVAESEYAREADHAREAGLVMWSFVEAKPTTLSGYGITDAAPLSMISATDTTFASAVRAVPTTDMPEDMPSDWGTYGTVGAALAALAAFVKWAKAKIVAVIGDDGKPTDQFATDLLGKPVAISAMRYGLVSTDETVKAADRTVTKVTLGTTAVTVTFPDADENGKTRDLLLRIDAANLATGGSLNITKPTGATIYGDAFPSPEATKQYLVAITETAANEFYVRTIEITIPTEA